MKFNKVLAAGAAASFAVLGHATDTRSPLTLPTLSLAPPAVSLDTPPISSALPAATTPATLPSLALAPNLLDHSYLWLLSDISLELPRPTNTTFEFGLGYYGVGGGINWYAGPGKTGLMYDARIGFAGAGAVNAEIQYVGRISDGVKWRVGVGAEYLTRTDVISGLSNIEPILTLDFGFRL